MRADRLLNIVQMLQAQGQVSVRELADRLEVSARTIQRDLEALSAGGIPVYAMRGAQGGWTLPEGYRSRLTGMTTGELQALLLLQTSSVVRDLALGEQAGSALAKLLAALPEGKRAEAEFVRRHLHIDGAGWHEARQPTPWLQAVQLAVWERRKLWIRYASARGGAEGEGERTPPERRLVSPWGLVAKQATWYFVAADEAAPAEEREGREGREGDDAELRTYRVSRLLEAEPAEERFESPPGFDLAAWWERSLRRFREALPRYPARLAIRDRALERLERERYAAVRHVVRPQADDKAAAGWLVADVEFHTLESARELLLSYGAAVRALAPPELRDAVAKEARLIAGLYEAEWTQEALADRDVGG